ncbi:MAG: sugar phosphate nucleotidyltransferase [Terracidiphilus sp.]
MTHPSLLVLAAGMGNRYGGLKQIDPVGPGGEAIVDYSVYDALRAGFRKLVFVIRKDIEQSFRQTVGARFEKHVSVEYVFQELDNIPQGFQVPAGRARPWGTAHAILTASGAIHEPFAVINADDFYGAESYRMLASHLLSGSPDYAMVGFILRNTLSDFGTVARGVCRVSGDGFLQHVVELTGIERDGAQVRNTDAAGRVTALTGDEVVSMNMWGFAPRVFAQLEDHFLRFLQLSGSSTQAECYIPNMVNDLVSAGLERVKVLRTHDSWFGITHREDHSRTVESIRRLIKDGVYPERLWL